MFSATWPPEVQKLAAAFLITPIKVTIGSQDLAASHTITQVVMMFELRLRSVQVEAAIAHTIVAVLFSAQTLYSDHECACLSIRNDTHHVWLRKCSCMLDLAFAVFLRLKSPAPHLT
jgi:hypothetical protein